MTEFLRYPADDHTYRFLTRGMSSREDDSCVTSGMMHDAWCGKPALTKSDTVGHSVLPEGQLG